MYVYIYICIYIDASDSQPGLADCRALAGQRAAVHLLGKGYLILII